MLWGLSVWFEIVISTGPAPTFDGDTVTSSSWITPVSATRTGARAWFSKSSSPQPPKSAVAIARPAHAVALIPTDWNLTEPDRFTRQYQVLQLLLDPQPDALREPPHERDVVGVLGSVAGHVDRLEEADAELRREVHRRRRETEVREGMVDREVDEPGEPLEQRHVREDRHRLLGAHHRGRHDRHAGAHSRAHEAAAAEAAQPIALPVQLAAGLLTLRKDEHELALIAEQPLRVVGMRPYEPDLVGEHADARIALEPVLSEHVERTRGRVLVFERLHDHRSVRGQGARVVGDDQRAALRRHVLNALDLHAKPVLVIEVEQGLHQVEDALRAAPVVDLTAGLGRWDQLAQLAQVRGREVARPGKVRT